MVVSRPFVFMWLFFKFRGPPWRETCAFTPLRKVGTFIRIEKNQ